MNSRWLAIISWGSATYVLAAALCLWRVGWLQGENDRLARERAELQSARRELEVVASKQEELAGQLEQRRRQLAMLDAIVPPDPALSGLQGVLRRLAEKNGLSMLRTTPAAEIDKDFYREIPMAVDAEGAFPGIRQFVSQLGRIQRLLNVDGVRLERVGQTRFRLVVNVVVFRYVDKPRP